MTAPLLTRYGKNAEIARGLFWIDRFENNEQIQRNDGTITGAPTINNGATFDGTNDYILYTIQGSEASTIQSPSEWSWVIEFTPDFAANDGNDHYIVDTSTPRNFVFKRSAANANVLQINFGDQNIAQVPLATYQALWNVGSKNTIVVSGQSGDTNAWLNGTQIITNDATAFTTPGSGTTLSVGSSFVGGGLFEGTIHCVRAFNVALTAQEATDYYNRQVWDYHKNVLAYYGLRARDHDPVNARILDSSGKGNNLTLGDGSTASTFPTKLTRRGYSFDGGDYALSGIGVSSGALTEITCMAVIRPLVTTPLAMIVTSFEDSGSHTPAGVLMYNTGTNTIQFYVGGTAGANAAQRVGYLEGSVAVIIGVHDGTNTKLYVNGIEETDAVTPLGPTVSANSRICLGERVALTATNYRGDILAHAVYNKGLTPVQAQDLYLNLIGRLNDV